MPRRAVQRPSIKMDDDEVDYKFSFAKIRTPSPDANYLIASEMPFFEPEAAAPPSPLLAAEVAAVVTAPVIGDDAASEEEFSHVVHNDDDDDDDDGFSHLSRSPADDDEDEEDWMLVDGGENEGGDMADALKTYRDAAVSTAAQPVAPALSKGTTVKVKAAAAGKAVDAAVPTLDERDLAKLPGSKQRKQMRKKGGRKR